MNSYDVLIIGGGVVGLTAALAMAQRGYHVAVIDSGSLTVDTAKTDARVYAMNKASQELLSKTGVWQQLDKARVSPYQHMHVWDGSNGAFIDFDSRLIAEPDLGSIIEESILKEALLNQVKAAPLITLFAHHDVLEIKESVDGVMLLSNTASWAGRLLMVADGARSPAREQLKVGLTQWSYQQQALVATVKTELPHQRTAFQVFNPDGPLAFLPLAESNQCSIVWSTDIVRAQSLIKLDEDAFNNELTKAFGKKLGAVHLSSARHQFPLHMRHVKQYSGSSWLLLGDAAHTIHPLAGLGLNVGLADIAAWLLQVDNSPNTLFTKKMLGAYQRERKSAVWQTILLMESFKRLFGQSIGPVSFLRGMGLRACNEFTPIKRLFVQHAAG